MDEVTPVYYAAGERPDVFTMRGSGFLGWPTGMVGIRSSSNANPLNQRYQTGDDHTYDVEIISDNEMVATLRESVYSTRPVYFAAILSEDRSKVYWVNNTRPLP